MNFWTALHMIGKLVQFIPNPQITSVTTSPGEVIYAIGDKKSVQYDLLRHDGALCIGTVEYPFPDYNWHRTPDRCLTVVERDYAEEKNKPFFDKLQSELEREDGPLYQFDKSKWVLTPDTIADLVGHIRMCKECLDKGLCLN